MQGSADALTQADSEIGDRREQARHLCRPQGAPRSKIGRRTEGPGPPIVQNDSWYGTPGSAAPSDVPGPLAKVQSDPSTLQTYKTRSAPLPAGQLRGCERRVPNVRGTP